MGLYSRSQSYELIRSGKVKVNGSVVTDPNRAIVLSDRILIDDKKTEKKKPRYILLHKPAGYVTTRRDEKNRLTVYDILGETGGWLFPIGRLDKDTEGLLIFTNDTAFGDRLTDPTNKVPRTYLVTTNGVISNEDVKKALGGVNIGRGEESKPVAFKITERRPLETVVEVTLTEGKNREIRRLFETLGKPVKRLVRTSFGSFKLGDIPYGKWREV